MPCVKNCTTWFIMLKIIPPIYNGRDNEPLFYLFWLPGAMPTWAWLSCGSRVHVVGAFPLLCNAVPNVVSCQSVLLSLQCMYRSWSCAKRASCSYVANHSSSSLSSLSCCRCILWCMWPSSSRLPSAWLSLSTVTAHAEYCRWEILATKQCVTMEHQAHQKSEFPIPVLIPQFTISIPWFTILSLNTQFPE